MMDLTNFIYHEKNLFSEDFCDKLIELFEEQDKKKLTYTGQMASGINTQVKNSTEINLFEFSEFLNLENLFQTINSRLSHHYLENLPFGYYFDANNKLFTQSCKYETCQIQKYKRNEGHYEQWHVEVENSESANRIFSMLIYLNDVYEGGETSFLYSDLNIKPTRGSLVIFPSSFPFVHCGKKPKSNDKYVISTWLVYDNQ